MAVEFNWPALPPTIATPELVRTLNLRLPALNRLSGSGVTGGASTGAAGLDVYTGLVGGVLQFRKLKAGANVTLNVLAGGELEVASTPPAGGTVYFANVFRSAANLTPLSTVAGNLNDSGNATAAMTDSAARALNRLYAKALLADPDTADAIAAGLSYVVTTLNQATGGGRGYAALDTTNILTTGVLQSATIANRRAATVAKGASGVVFLEDFEQLPGGEWSLFNAGGTLSLQSGGGVTGGKALRIVGDDRRGYAYNIPYDPSKLYRFRARLKQVADPTAGGKGVYLYLKCYAADGTTALADSYVVLNNFIGLVAGAAYSTVTGWFMGEGGTVVNPAPDPLAPTSLPAGTRYIRPAWSIGLTAGNGTVDLDYLAIDQFDEDDATRTYTLLDVGSKMKTGALESGGKALNRLFAKAGAGDVDTVDTIAALTGTSYGITLLTALTSGQVDLAKAGVVGKVSANILRAGGGAALSAILASLTDAGDAAAGMKVSDGVTRVDRLFAKGALADLNTIDTIALLSGSTYGAPLLTALTSGSVDLAKSGVIGNLAAARISAASLSAITATLGTITSGLLQNATTSPTASLRLAATNTLPSTAYNYIDLAATGSAYVLRFGPSTTSATLTYTADGTLSVLGVIKPTQITQTGTGSGDFAGSNLFTGTAVFGETTATRTAGKRFDFVGGRFRMLADAVSRFELGDFTTVGGVPVTAPKTDTGWTVTTGAKSNSATLTWSTSDGAAAGPTNPIAVAADLFDQNNQYALDFSLSITQSWLATETQVTPAQVRARLYTSKVAGGVAANWKDQGVIASLTHSGVRGATTTLAFAGVVATVLAADLDGVTNGNSVFKIVPEVYAGEVDDVNGIAVAANASGSADVVGGTSKIAWNKITSAGTQFARRFPVFRTIAGQPLAYLEPNTLANLPADNAGADGEFAYSSDDHAPYFWDGIRRGVVQPEVFKRLTAANAATTSTTGADVVNLTLAVQAGEVWEIEWAGEVLLSVTTATLGFNVASTGTFTARSGYQGQCPAGAPNTGAGIMRTFQNAAGTATGTAGGMGNPGSATLGVPFRVAAYLKIATTGTISLQLASSSGTITAQEGSRMSAWRVA